MNKKHDTPKQRSLRLISPKVYNYITETLEQTHNIHSYDLKMDAIPKQDGITIIVRFGETFSHHKEQYFTFDQLEEGICDELKEFVTDLGEACTKVLIDDYFKIYAP